LAFQGGLWQTALKTLADYALRAAGLYVARHAVFGKRFLVPLAVPVARMPFRARRAGALPLPWAPLRRLRGFCRVATTAARQNCHLPAFLQLTAGTTFCREQALLFYTLLPLPHISSTILLLLLWCSLPVWRTAARETRFYCNISLRKLRPLLPLPSRVADGEGGWRMFTRHFVTLVTRLPYLRRGFTHVYYLLGG